MELLLYFLFFEEYSPLQVVLVVKNLPASVGNVRDVSSIPGSGKSPGEGNGYRLQYSCLENPMNRGAWQTTVYRFAKSRSWLKQHDMHAYAPTPFQLCGSGGSCQFSQHHAFSCHSWLADRWISDPNKVSKNSSLGVFRAEKIIQPPLWWKLWCLDAVTGQVLCYMETTLLWEEKMKPLGRKKVEIKKSFWHFLFCSFYSHMT